MMAVWLATGSADAAQTNTGEITGLVRDLSGGVLPGATVIGLHTASGTVVERTTDGAGRFYLPSLRVGTWDVTVSFPGFATETRRGVLLVVGHTLDLQFTLTVSGLATEISVDAATPLLQQTTAEISDVIENREVVEIPLNGRQFLSLAQLSDGVVIPPGGTRGEALQQAGPLPNVGGQRSGHNIYLLDGAKVTDELFNNLVINPSVDAIEEFRIRKSMYPPSSEGRPRRSSMSSPRLVVMRFAEAVLASSVTTPSTPGTISIRGTNRCSRCARRSSAAPRAAPSHAIEASSLRATKGSGCEGR